MIFDMKSIFKYSRIYTTTYCSSNRARDAILTTLSRYVSSSSSATLKLPPPLELSYDVVAGDNSKNPLLILHGLFGNKTNWRSTSKVINRETKRTVIAVDLRNHGDSPHSKPEDSTLPAMANDVKQLIDKLDIKKCILMGHSMGGRVTSQFCHLFPESAEEIIMVDMSPLEITIMEDSRRNEMLDFVSGMKSAISDPDLNLPSSSLFQARKVIDQKLSKVVSERFVRAFLLLNLVKDKSTGRLSWKFNLDAINYMLINQIIPRMEMIEGRNKTYEGQSLMIYGGLSNYLREKEIPAIKKMYPNSMFHCVKDAGHYLHVEKPNEFLGVVSKFLQ